jgi:hypothetical protein
MIEKLNILEEYFKNVSVYKSLFICSIDIQDDIYKNLILNDNTVLNIRNNSDIDNIREFSNLHVRIILINVLLWNIHKDLIQNFVLPHQNLLILLDISEYQNYIIKYWIRASDKNGYITRSLNPTILDLDEN